MKCQLIKEEYAGKTAQLTKEEKEEVRQLSYQIGKGNMSELVRDCINDFLSSEQIITKDDLKKLGKISQKERDYLYIKIPVNDFRRFEFYAKSCYISISPLIRYLIKYNLLRKKKVG